MNNFLSDTTKYVNKALKFTDFRTAAFKVAIDKIALSYDFIGL